MRLPTRCCLVVAVALALTACRGDLQPDLARLYATGMEQQATPPVILIPGILGSRLIDPASDSERWPGSLLNLLLHSKQDLALKIDTETLQPLADGLQPNGLFESAFNRDFYGAILQTLRKAGGFVPGKIGVHAAAKVRRYYVFAYDWRQDNVDSARRLDELIEQIRRDYGDPKLKVNIIAHSMGGLVTRYYLRYGTVDALSEDGEFPINMSGAAKVGTVVLLGTPNLGSVQSLQGMILGPAVGFNRVPPEVVATMPSVYQLLPHPLTDWAVTVEGRDLNLDLYDVETWRRFEWSVFNPEVLGRVRANFKTPQQGDEYIVTLQAAFARNLERARRFIWSITFEEPESPVRLVVFGGDCVLTPARIVVEQQGEQSVARLLPQDVRRKSPGVDYSQLMLEPGDGQVTKPSLLARQSLNPVAPQLDALFFPLAYAFFLCESHARLTGNINFQDNLLNILLTRQTRDGDADRTLTTEAHSH